GRGPSGCEVCLPRDDGDRGLQAMSPHGLGIVLSASERDCGPSDGHRTRPSRVTGGCARLRKTVGWGEDRSGRAGRAARRLLAPFQPAWPGIDRGRRPPRGSCPLTKSVLARGNVGWVERPQVVRPTEGMLRLFFPVGLAAWRLGPPYGPFPF